MTSRYEVLSRLSPERREAHRRLCLALRDEYRPSGDPLTAKMAARIATDLAMLDALDGD